MHPVSFGKSCLLQLKLFCYVIAMLTASNSIQDRKDAKLLLIKEELKQKSIAAPHNTRVFAHLEISWLTIYHWFAFLKECNLLHHTKLFIQEHND